MNPYESPKSDCEVHSQMSNVDLAYCAIIGLASLLVMGLLSVSAAGFFLPYEVAERAILIYLFAFLPLDASFAFALLIFIFRNE